MESYENSNLSCLTLSWKILFLSEKEKKKKKKKNKIKNMVCVFLWCGGWGGVKA